MSFFKSKSAELPIAFVVTVVGMVLAVWAVVTHAATLVAPGATLIFLGGAWLGNALARHDVRLFPAPLVGERAEEEGR